MKTWLISIIPPRPHFDQDATPAEQALMDQHFVYWKDLNQKGVCLFGGPVLDPKGVYGILVVRAATEDEARALGNGDPAAKGGLIKIEVAEMRVVFMPVHAS
ncbi:MAG: YciI family protein [Terracidiphilus sp.]|nr:YciI family protein [Terracidiphilus sp.]MDR3797351.1 YciI family protein [Terracidiphilus sp.]